jgi:hypothetical protein
MNRDRWGAWNERRKVEAGMNGVRPNGYYQPEALQKRSRERAGEVGDRRLEASVTNGADGAFRIRRVMVEKSAE